MRKQLTPIIALLNITLLFCVNSDGLCLDFLPDDVRSVVDNNVVTPVRTTLLNVLARKLGVIDFFVNFIRGARYTFFKPPAKQHRKPRHGFNQQTTKLLAPLKSQYGTTLRPYIKQASSINYINGIYVMTPPNLATTTESPLELDNEEKSTPITSQQTPSFSSEFDPILDSNDNNIPEDVKQKLTISDSVFSSPSWQELASSNLIAERTKHKSNTFRKVLADIFRHKYPFTMHRMENYTVMESPRVKDINNDTGKEMRHPLNQISFMSSQELSSKSNVLKGYISQGITYHRYKKGVEEKNETENVSSIFKSMKNQPSFDKLQVLSREIEPLNRTNVTSSPSEPSQVLCNFSHDIEKCKHDNKDTKVKNYTPPSQKLLQMVKKLVPENEVDDFVDDYIDKNLHTINQTHHLASVNISVDSNKSKDKLIESSSRQQKGSKKLSNLSNKESFQKGISNHNDDFVHRFQFYYSPKQRTFGFQSTSAKENNAMRKMTRINKKKRKKRRNKSKMSEMKNDFTQDIRGKIGFQNKRNPKFFHFISAFSTESPVPSVYLNYRYDNLWHGK